MFAFVIIKREEYTEKKKHNFLNIKGNSDGIGCKVIYMRKGFLIYEEIANISPYMKRPLVM
jgi:hypothetical protein